MESLKSIYNRLLRQEPSIHPATQTERTAIQTIELEMLDDIIAFCDKHDLTVLLGGGSCLGSVRHGGFIPWDDDLDFNMPREDFEIFKEHFETELGNKYILYAPNYKSQKTQWRFAKIEKKGTLLIDSNKKECCHGICVDIFPIEKIPQKAFNRLLKGILIEGVMFAAGQVWFDREAPELFIKAMKKTAPGTVRCFLKKISGKVFGLYPLNKWYDLVDRCCQYNGDTNLMGVPTGRKHYFGEIFDAAVYLPKKETLFEGHKAYLPNKEDVYLTNLYGNYMEIPSENKREHHYIYGLQIDEKI